MGNPVGRNDPCPCGSGKKYKHCHFDQDQQELKNLLPQEVLHISSPNSKAIWPVSGHDPFEYGQGERLRGFQREIDLITESLKNYRPEIILSFRTITWNCKSKVTRFFVSLTRKMRHYELLVSFAIEPPMFFQLTSKDHDYQPSPFSNEVLASNPAVNDLFEITSESTSETKELIDQLETISFLTKLTFFDSVLAERNHILARKEESDRSTLELWSEAFHSLSMFVRYLAHFSYHIQPRNKLGLCPYCRAPVAKTESVVTCASCHSVEHEDCWKELGHCAIFGCQSKEGIVRRA